LDRLLYICAALAGFLGVALGAFAAHGLKTTLAPEMLSAFETGVRYQMYHALHCSRRGRAVAGVRCVRAGCLSPASSSSRSLYLMASTACAGWVP
jgi:uncharacterized membrane protein YgdD (TMEM256/DUF423 family)